LIIRVLVDGAWFGNLFVLLAWGVAGRDRRFGSWMSREGIGRKKA